MERIEVDKRNPSRAILVLKNIAFLYGHRPCTDKSLWYLSPYEFMIYWRIEPATYCRKPNAKQDAYHCLLTNHGEEKLKDWTYNQEEPVELKAGIDYQVKEVPPPKSD